MPQGSSCRCLKCRYGPDARANPDYAAAVHISLIKDRITNNGLNPSPVSGSLLDISAHVSGDWLTEALRR